MQPTVVSSILILTLLSTTTTAAARTPAHSPSDDDRFLLAFKSKADITTTFPSLEFNATSPHCTWTGVTCSPGTTRVVKLILENLPLGGVIPPNTLSRLDQLRVLSLKNDSLTGPIPDLSGLINLKLLFLTRNSFSGHFPPSISTLHRLRTIDFAHNNLTGPLPAFLAELERLTFLRLESNRFTGPVPALNQSTLTGFNVSNNDLSGPVPVTATFARFGHSAFVKNPALCGAIVHKECRPKIRFFGGGGDEPSPAPGGGGLGGGGSEEMTAAAALAKQGGGGGKQRRKGLVLGFVVGVLGLVAGVLCFTLAVRRSRRKKYYYNHHHHQDGSEIDRSSAAADAAEVMRTEAEREEKVKSVVSGIKFPAPAAVPAVVPLTLPAVGQQQQQQQSPSPTIARGTINAEDVGGGSLMFCAGEERLYTVEQLMRGSAELLGRGTMGTTYKAVLDNRLIVCVKRLDGTKLAGAGKEAFERHLEAVGGLRHPNLVPLRAYFQAKEERLLVYDYQPNGSLFSLIHGSKSARAKPLHWTPCLKIAEDVAQGLSYIHQAWRLVHGNLKSTNILLGPDFEACLTDYCLTPLADDSVFNNTQTDPDSSAYRAPETRGSIHEVTSKSDVYAFGVLLLELLSGKPPHQHPYLAPREIVRWVMKIRGINANAGAGAGGGDHDHEEEEESRLTMLLQVAVSCSVSSPEQRPTMWQVLKMLQEIKEAATLAEEDEDDDEDGGCDSDPSLPPVFAAAPPPPPP